MAFDFNNNGQQRPTPENGAGKPYRSTSGGFGNRPVGTSGRTGATDGPGNLPNPVPQPRRTPTPPRPNPYPGGGMGGFLAAIPWRIILPILVVVVAVALVIVFRYEITEFLLMLLTWAIIAGVAFLIVRGIFRWLFRWLR